MSRLQRLYHARHMHIPTLHGIGVVLSFSFLIFTALYSIIVPYNTFGYTSQYQNPHYYEQAYIVRVSSQSSHEDIISGEVHLEKNIKSYYAQELKNSQSGNIQKKSLVVTQASHRTNIFENNISQKYLLNQNDDFLKAEDTREFSAAPELKKNERVYNTSDISLPKGYEDVLSSYQLRTDKTKNYFLENGVWYGYNYSKYKNFGTGIIPSSSDLEKYNLLSENTLLAIDGQNVYFVSEFKRVRLVSDSVIAGISNKDAFLRQVLKDQKYIELESDAILTKLKSETQRITNGKSHEQKISAIYSYIISHVRYPENFSATNGKILSGISTYEHGVGSCGGYAHLFQYMLSFAGIEGARVIEGHVIDAKDFPNIGHAWVQIGNLYYDPTFDDPSGVSQISNSSWSYFALPYDLFYVNRYNFGTLPSNLKALSLDERRAHIQLKLKNLSDRYSPESYSIFAYYGVTKGTAQVEKTIPDLQAAPEEIKDKIIAEIGTPEKYISEEKKSLEQGTKTISQKSAKNISDLKSLIPYYEVKNYNYIKNEISYTIIKMQYYTITDENFNTLMEQINYDLSNMSLYKWDNGTYRLTYGILEQ